MYYFSVTGSGDFPFVLLAICQAWPVDADEARKISLACPTVAPEQTISLASRSEPNANIWKVSKWPIRKIFR